MNIETLLLLNAAYLRKSNHPEESDDQIQAGIVEDILKIEQGISSVEINLAIEAIHNTPAQ